jgi:aminoglycoside phosphotransferase (APT) family kinase protein
MTQPWVADTELTGEGAARLIEAQFPALSPVQIEMMGVGWDNAAFTVNDRYVFRFPRRQIAAKLIEREARILPLLAPHLPLPIPLPEFIGQDNNYPYPFAGYRMLPGITADRAVWTDETRAACALPLAQFLSALHRIPVDNETRQWAPGDEIERTNLPKRLAVLRERLQHIAPRIGEAERASVERSLEHLAGTPSLSAPTCWVHGDLYARHFLVDESNIPCGVIDWGDVHLGDPALDLSIACSFLPSRARPAFREAYGHNDDTALWDRARFRALSYGVLLTHYGLEVGDEAILAAGEYALNAALAVIEEKCG